MSTTVTLDTDLGTVSETCGTWRDLAPPRDAKSKKKWDTERKILAALEESEPRGLGSNEIGRRTHISPRILPQRLRSLQERQWIWKLSDPESRETRWRLNGNVPIPMASVSAYITAPGSPESYPIFEVRRGRLELTREIEDAFKAKQLSMGQIVDHLNRLCWDGLRHRMPVA